MENKHILSRNGPLTEQERKSWLVLEAIRKSGPLTKTDISRITGLNIVTVSNYVNNYISCGLVLAKGFNSSTGGRKPEVIELNSHFGFAMGIDLGVSGLAQAEMIAVLTDLSGRVVARIKRPRPEGDMGRLLARTIGLISELMESCSVEVEKIKGVVIGVNGILDERAGTVREFSRNASTSDYISLINRIEHEFGIPASVTNAATMAVFGEKIICLNQDAQNIIYMHSDVDCGIMINGEIYKGISGSAGELGFNEFNGDDFIWAQKHPLLRPRGLDLGILSQAQRILEDGAESKISENPDAQMTTETIVEAAREGDKLAMELIEDAGVALGMRIAYLVNVINPEIVIIGGGVERAESLLLNPVKKMVRKYAFEEAASAVRIIPSCLGEDAVSMGAAGFVIRAAFVGA